LGKVLRIHFRNEPPHDFQMSISKQITYAPNSIARF
jgi:hypothetical protein